MDAPYYNGAPGECPWDRDYEKPSEDERCPSCGAHPDDPCEQMCDCSHCTTQRLRTMDVDPEGEVA